MSSNREGSSSSRSDSQLDRRRFLKASGAGAVAVSLAGCGSGQSTPASSPTETTDGEMTTDGTGTPTTTDGMEPSFGGTFTYGMVPNPDSPNPLVASSVYSSLALGLVYDFPMRSDPVTFQPKPWLYTDWEIRNIDNDDPVRVFWNLRDGAKFADGSDLTAEDVLFNYRYQGGNKVEQLGFYTYFEYDDTSRSDAVGMLGPSAPEGEEFSGLPIVRESDEANWDFQGRLSQPVFNWQFSAVGGPYILPKEIWEGVDYQNFDPLAEDVAFGTKAGRLTQFQPDTRMQVQIEEDSYYRNTLMQLDWIQEHEKIVPGGPFAETFNFRIFGSESAMTQALLNREIDTLYETIQPSRESDVRESDVHDIVTGFESGFNYHGYNVKRRPFDDLALRQAMNFMWDERFWTVTLQGQRAADGDYPQSPGYPAGRPETYNDAELLTAPETELYSFRSESEGVPRPDVEAVAQFLMEGNVATGEEQTVAGMEYPGGFYDDVTASQTEAKYDYTYGPVQSQVLQQVANPGPGDEPQEIRVNGQTIPQFKEANSEPITILTDPASDAPRQIKAMNTWAQNCRQLGLPVRIRTLSFNALLSDVATAQDFDIAELGWGGTSEYGASNYFFFNSRWDRGEGTYSYNSTGYSARDEFLNQANQIIDLEEGARAWAKSMEMVYLDSPYHVFDFTRQLWPVNSGDWTGFVDGLVGPAFASWTTQAENLHQRQ